MELLTGFEPVSFDNIRRVDHRADWLLIMLGYSLSFTGCIMGLINSQVE